MENLIKERNKLLLESFKLFPGSKKQNGIKQKLSIIYNQINDKLSIEN